VIRLVALDVDGTLVGDDLTISSRVHAAIQAVQQTGDTIVTLATGRMFDFVAPMAKALGTTAPLICYQGGMIKSILDTAPLYQMIMPSDVMHQVLAWQWKRNTRLVLYADDDVFLTERTYSEAYYRYFLGNRLVWVDDLATVVEEHTPIKFVVFVDPDEAETIRDELAQQFDGRIEVTRSHQEVVEGNPAGVSKGNALQWLAAYLSIRRTEAMAIGDHDNDISMVIWAGLGVAMGNASPALKAVADWIAPPMEQDGVAAALERFVLRKERPVNREEVPPPYRRSYTNDPA